MAQWKQGVTAGGRHWVSVPGVVKPINAGNAERAELIARAVNSHDALVAALRAYVEDDDIGARLSSARYRAAAAALRGAKGDR
ncbi:MAG: hypothetical protein AB7G13_11600 [Lautropia sp.]